MQLIFILALLFGLLIAIVVLQNSAPTTLTLLLFRFENVAVAVLVLASMAVGAIMTLLLGLGGWVRSQRAIRQRDRRIAQLEAELTHTRSTRVLPRVEPPAAKEPPGGDSPTSERRSLPPERADR